MAMTERHASLGCGITLVPSSGVFSFAVEDKQMSLQVSTPVEQNQPLEAFWQSLKSK